MIGAALALALVGCAPKRPPVDVGLVEGYRAELVQGRLNNPSCVSFRPGGGLTVVDSGNGAVFLWEEGKTCPTPLVTGFVTEHWKVDAKTGEKRFKLGPLSAVWLDAYTLAVTDGGLPDGKETVNFYHLTPGKKARAGLQPLTAVQCEKSNAVGPTTKRKDDKGEGNLTGMCLSADGGMLFVCGQGSDAATWLLSCDVRKRRLKPLLSADAHGVKVNSPMQCLYVKPGWLYALYSGDGGKEDGLIVRWDLATGKPSGKWTLPGLVDPMGMAFVPGGGGELVVVDNNWALKKVNPGSLARVRLPAGKGAAEVKVIATGLKGQVSCAFSPDGKLYVAALGDAFDAGQGVVIAIEGLVPK
jgi:hypothetical protein